MIPDHWSKTFLTLLTLVSSHILMVGRIKKGRHTEPCIVLWFKCVYQGNLWYTYLKPSVSFTVMLHCSQVDAPWRAACVHWALWWRHSSLLLLMTLFPLLSDSCNASADELLSLFNSTCTDILDSMAPFTTSWPKSVTKPWLNDTTRALWHENERESGKRKTFKSPWEF